MLGEYSTLLLFHFLVVLSIIYCSERLPSLNWSQRNVSTERKGNGKKLLWLFSSSLFITLIAFLMLYLNEIEARKDSVRLNLVDSRHIEFPNFLDDMDRDLYVPFRCQFPEDKVRVKFFRYNKGKKENVNRKINMHKEGSSAARISLTGDGEFIWIEGGSVDVNIPISANCIENGKVKILISLFDGASEKYIVPYEFETLAPVPETRTPWTISSSITHSEIEPGKEMKVIVDAVNSGQEGSFEFVLDILHADTQGPVSKDTYEIANPTNTQFIIHQASRFQHEWVISFKKMGTYLLKTGVKKNIWYLDLPANRESWSDSYSYQNLFVAVTDGTAVHEKVTTPDTDAIESIAYPTEETTAPYDAYMPEAVSETLVYSFDTQTQKRGAVLYGEPFEEGVAVATNIRKGAHVIVSGKGNDASEVIANSDRYVKTEVVKLNKTGYMEKRFLSAVDTQRY